MAGRNIANKPDRAALAAYLAAHTNVEAAAHFGISVRTVVRYRGLHGLDYHAIRNPECAGGLTAEQMELLDGSLLGDGMLERPWKEGWESSRFRMRLGVHDCAYLEAVRALLGPFVTAPFREERSEAPTQVAGKVIRDGSTERFCESLILLTINHPLFGSLRQRWYPNGVKIVPADLVVTPTVLLHWYCQDGSHNPAKRNACLSTCGFSDAEAERLAALLEPLGCRPAIWRNAGKPVLGFGNAAYDALLAIVEPSLAAVGMERKGGHRPRKMNWTRRTPPSTSTP